MAVHTLVSQVVLLLICDIILHFSLTACIWCPHVWSQVGSCFIVEATREAAEAFVRDDPFFKAGVWKQVSVNRYVSIPNGILAHE